MMVVSVDTDPEFRAGQPQPLFEDVYQSAFLGSTNYDVDPDGARFLMIQANQESSQAAQLKVVLNWTEELKRLADER